MRIFATWKKNKNTLHGFTLRYVNIVISNIRNYISICEIEKIIHYFSFHYQSKNAPLVRIDYCVLARAPYGGLS